MQDADFATSPRPSRHGVRALWRAAAHALGLHDRLLCAIGGTIFLIAAIFAVLLVAETPLALAPAQGNVVPYAVSAAVLAAASVVCLIWPLWLGRLRLVGRMCLSDETVSVSVRELFYCFTSPARYRRAMRLALYAFLTAVLPAALMAGIGYDLAVLDARLAAALPPLAAFLLSAVLWCLAAGLTVLYLWLSARLWLALPVALGNEEMGVLTAWRTAWRAGRGHGREVFGMLWGSTWRLFVSLAAVCVPYLLYFSHQTVGAWFLLAARCTKKGEDNYE